MILRNGINSTLRSRARSALFSVLILLLTLILALGMGLWSYCARTLSAMDQVYTSVALVEYMGENYPEETAADPAARDMLAQLENWSTLDGVELWETTRRGVALSQGYKRVTGDIPYEDMAVVAVFSMSPKYVRTYGEIPPQSMPQMYIIYNYAEEGTSTCTIRIDDQLWEDIPYYNHASMVKEEDQVYCLATMRGMYVMDRADGTTIDCTQLMTNDEYWLRQDPSTGKIEGWYMAAAGYSGIIGENLYSYEGKSGVVIEVDPGESGFVPESGKRYLLHGQLFDSGSSSRAMVVTDFYEGCDEAPWVEFEDYDDPILTDSIFTEYAQKYEQGNNYIQLEVSDRIDALEPFHQGTLYLEEGRFPQAGEAGVCLITRDLATQLELEVGDTLPVDLMVSQEEEPYVMDPAGESRSWTVVGITNLSESYPGWVWITQGETLPENPFFGYLLGRAVLDNDKAVAAVEQMQATAPEGVRVSLYDQGYASAAQPLQAMEATAQGVTIAAAVGALAVLCLFAILFVGRQQQAVDVMVSLGTPRGKIRLWLLSGAGVVAGAAALVGGAVGCAVMNPLVGLALELAQSLYAADRRYSQGSVGLIQDFSLPDTVPLWPAWVAAGCVFVAALVLCVAFLGQAQRRSTPRQGRVTVRVPKGGTSVAGRGAARFALLSARRGGWRSAVVPGAALVLCLFMGFLVATAQSWEAQRQALYDNTQLTGQFTSVNGRRFHGLGLTHPEELLNSGLVKELELSFTTNYWLEEEMPVFADTSFGDFRREMWITQQPDLVFCNALSATPEFIYGQTPQVTWLEGWDESFLADPSLVDFERLGGELNLDEVKVWPCIASSRWLEEHGFALGDEVGLAFGTGQYNLMQVVGSYAPTGSEDNLYLPLPTWLTEDGQYVGYTFSTCRFTLNSAGDLEAFRSWLAQEGYSQPGVVDAKRLAVMLNDQSFVETVQALGRYISLSSIVFPVLFALMGVLGFIISWLMVNGRRMEFAMMRGLGASRGRVFGSFFLEQWGLSLAGCLVGCALANLLWGQPLVWLAGVVFGVCYWVGCALAVSAVGRVKLMALLAEGQ